MLFIYTNMRTQKLNIIFLIFLLLIFIPVKGFTATSQHPGDKHYNKNGFFDIHVCNWPNRPVFFLALFSTTEFKNISKIEIFDNNKQHIGNLDLTKYRIVTMKDPKREKRAFIKQFDIPASSGNGWYSTKIHLKDELIETAQDYVVIEKMPRADGVTPIDNTTNIDAPEILTWKPVPGAKFYQVFIKDNWEAKMIYSSSLLAEPRLKIPKNLLQKGGSYCWKINARDVNENVLLGDFNHGSLSKCFNFELKE